MWEELKGRAGDKHVSATDRGQEVTAGFEGMEEGGFCELAQISSVLG